MPTQYSQTDQFRSAVFHAADLTGATFRDCDLSGVRIVSSQVADLRIAGFDGRAGTVVVDDVDVTAFVAGEPDRRHPERVRLRSVRTADDHREMWALIERLWSETLARAERLPEAALHERVDGEWSFVETLRHLVFATEGWVGRMLLGGRRPYSRLALGPTDIPPSVAVGLGMDPDAQPAYAEVAELFAGSRDDVRGVVEGLTDGELEENRTGALGPAEWGEDSHPVRHCLTVLLREHVEHRRYAERDLARLGGR